MSYILDALKKADRERERARVPTIETVHYIPLEKHGSRQTGIIGVGALILAVVVGLFFFLDRKESSPVPAATAPPAATSASSASAAEVRTVADISPNAAVSTTAAATPATSTSVLPAQSVTTDQPVAPSTPQPPAVAVSASVPGSEAAPPEQSTLTAEKNTPEATTAPVHPIAPSQSEVRSVATTPVSTPLEERKPASALRQNAERPVPGGHATPGSKSLAELAATLKISVHVYSENHAESIVFLNGRRYHEGDRVTDDCTLESITPNGIILRQGEERITLRPGT